MQEVCRLFMEEGDEKALSLLYEITKDELCNILLKWRKEYEVDFENVFTSAFQMYEEIITYLWDKYNIDE